MGAMKYKNIVLFFLTVLIVMGAYGLMTMNKDEFPTFEIKQGLIAVAYPGADVDQMVKKWRSRWRKSFSPCRKSSAKAPE